MESRRPNRLIKEKSPYLQQHARNPVDWYPWGKEAFARAKKADKPVFLSIGYSSCHWCHVMEKESFEDPDVAGLLNASFISVKVDREERPDLDRFYMSVCQALTGRGGWPLTVVLTPDKKPFFAGTYFPKSSRFGRPGLLELLPRLSEAWKTGRQDMLQAAENIGISLEQMSHIPAGEGLGKEMPAKAFEGLTSRYDDLNGGFGDAPKFPAPHNLFFLLRYWSRTGNEQALRMVEKTLERMRLGGMYDHLGFGFHRYSTDARWLVPHFEKMLYDQALLAMAYTEAYQATGKIHYRETAEEILAYVVRDMTRREGGFYSAEDADAEGEEGKSYLWTEEEIRQALPPQPAELAVRIFAVKKDGNFSEAGGYVKGRNILYLKKPLEELAVDFGLPVSELKAGLAAIRKKLYAVREKRPQPFKDKKILTDWNSLMIAALAKAAQAFDEPAYGAAAVRTADFILEKMVGPDGALCHRFMEGEASYPGFLDDYAFLIWGLLELYEAVFDVRYLETAFRLCDYALAHFWDKAQGGFYFVPEHSSDVPFRDKEAYDGAYPSGNSAMMLNLLRLGRMGGRPGFEEKAIHTGQAFSRRIFQAPSAYNFWMTALEFALAPSLEVVIAGNPGSADTKAMLRSLRQPFLPSKVVLVRPGDSHSPKITKIAPFTKAMKTAQGKVTAYVCTNYACQHPTTNSQKMLELLRAQN
jgi:uncharacterized protein YyaL (SSP411 family)